MGATSIWHWVILLALIAIPAAYILSFIKTTKLLRAKEIATPVHSAWLLLVPALGAIWFFVLLIKLKDALKYMNTPIKSRWFTFGMMAGLAYIVGAAVISILPELAALALLAWVVFGALHWVELVSLRSQIQKPPAGQ